MDVAKLTQIVAQDSALRRRQSLQPVGGKGDKIFPPTYPPSDEEKRTNRNAPPRHVFERRRLNGEEIWCVLVDSAQSQANRLEESLLRVIRENIARIPYVVVDFSGKGLEGISTITSLEAPHRVYDAIFRDSLLDGKPFLDKESPLGKRLVTASLADATALLETSPTALLFGSWHSTGSGGGLGAKFARCLVSEIVAVNVPVDDFKNPIGVRVEDTRRGFVVNVRDEDLKSPRAGQHEASTAGRRTGSRIDPLGILSSIKIYKKSGEDTWTTFESEAEKNNKGEPVLYVRKDKSKAGKPSVINHGNVKPSVEPLGITCDYLEHSVVLSFAGLRRLRFGPDAKKNEAGRALLAALGMLAVTEQDLQGYALRSRCDLVCEGKAPLEIVHADGSTDTVSLDASQARELYRGAFDAAKSAGFAFRDEPIRLVPEDKLVRIVQKSQELALAGKGDDDSETKGEENSQN